MSEPDYIKTFDKIAEFAKQFIREYEDMNNSANTQDQDDVVYEYISAEYSSSAERVTLYTPELSFIKHDGFCKKCRSTGFVKVENKGIDDMYEACECFYDIPKYEVSEITVYALNGVYYNIVDSFISHLFCTFYGITDRECGLIYVGYYSVFYAF